MISDKTDEEKKEPMNRREFLKGTAWMGAVAAAAGCKSYDLALGTGFGGSMDGFAVPPLERIRVGVVGLGHRGADAARRLSTVPGVEVTALCDLRPEQIAYTQSLLKKNGVQAKLEFTGSEGWKRMCEADIDLVYNVTDWAHHTPICVYAMEHGKHAFMEVPAAVTVEECWQLVETAERMRRHCMMLENCNYGDTELLMYNLCQSGALGELVHAECAYIHDLRWNCYETGENGYWDHWRLRFNAAHKGNGYPTHGFGPVCWYMDINRGDALDYLVSLESQQANFEHYARETRPGGGDQWKRDTKVAMGDMNTTLVKTVKGRSIMIQHDVSTPRPYSRINLITGTKGAFWGMPWRVKGVDQWRVALEDKCGDRGADMWRTREEAKDIEEKYQHQMWREAGKIAKLAGGHGGKDFMMDLRWVYCLQNGLPLDISVYDSASWSCIRELSEISVRAGSAPQKIPDFTRGGWKTAKPLGDMKIDFTKLLLTPKFQDLLRKQDAGFKS